MLLFGALADKEVDAMLPALAERAAAVVLSRPESKRARDPESLRALLPDLQGPVLVEPTIPRAVRRAMATAEAARLDLVVACGSIYLAGAVRREVLARF